MRLFEEMKTNKNRVRALLVKHPHLRDDDNRLIATYWFFQLGRHKVEAMTATDFMHYYAEGNLTKAESIRRVRQKLQEQEPSLRGENYHSRKDDGNDTRTDIHDL